MLVTIDIPPIVGRVCYLDATQQNPTVECYSNKTAYRFENSNRLLIGDWVRISGQIRVGKNRNKKTGLIDGVRNYYHDPFDGSNKSNWTFLELINPSCSIMGPVYLSNTLFDAIEKSKLHIENWSQNRDKTTLLLTINSLQKATDALYEALREITRDEADKNAKPIKFPEISYDDL